MLSTLSIISLDQGRGIYVPDPVPTDDIVPPVQSVSTRSGWPRTLLSRLRRIAAALIAAARTASGRVLAP